MFRKSKKSSPAGTLGGQCIDAPMGQLVCNPPLVCGYDGIGKRVCKAPAPGYKPSPSKNSPSGSYGMPCKQLSDNMSTCNKGLTCVSGVPSPVCLPPGPSGPSGPSGPTPSGPRPPGTLGGACMPNVTISGRPLPRCAPPAKCDTNDGSSTFGKCILPTPSGPATKSGMGSKEILTIIGLIFLGLCFLCGLAKMGMKDAKRKSNCDKACGTFVFLGVALIAVSSVLKSSN